MTETDASALLQTLEQYIRNLASDASTNRPHSPAFYRCLDKADGAIEFVSYLADRELLLGRFSLIADLKRELFTVEG